MSELFAGKGYSPKKNFHNLLNNGHHLHSKIYNFIVTSC